MASEIQISESLVDQSLTDLEKQQIQYRIFKLGFLESIQFKLWGHVKIGSITRGKSELEAHLFECDEHGLQVATPTGHYELLLCPECMKERNKQRVSEETESIAESIGKAKILDKYLSKNMGYNK